MLSKSQFSIKNKPKILLSIFKIENRATNLAKIQRRRIENIM